MGYRPPPPPPPEAGPEALEAYRQHLVDALARSPFKTRKTRRILAEERERRDRLAREGAG